VRCRASVGVAALVLAVAAIVLARARASQEAPGGVHATAPPSIPALEPVANGRPNTPEGFASFSDQSWDRIVRPPGPVGRLAARAEALLSSAPARDAGWSYLRRSSSKDDDIVVDATAPVSPPHVLRIIFTPNMRKDHEPSVHWIGLPLAREVHATWWIKLSANWTPSPAGGGKMTFLHLAPSGQGQAYTGLFGSTEPHHVSVNTEWPPYGQKIWDPNRETTPILYDRWYRIEWHVKWESAPGAGDATIAWRVNGRLNGEYTNLRLPERASAFQQFEFAPTLQNPPRAEQYMYVDHTSIALR
jgi:hypothetical protein